MTSWGTQQSKREHRVVLVTGASGAGRSTALDALEDLGFEIIDNLPLSLVPRLFQGAPLERPIALGIDVRNRDFTLDTLAALLDGFARDPAVAAELIYLDCEPEVLLRRYSETRRRHPLASDMPPDAAVEREIALLAPLRARADLRIDTTAMTPHDLRAEIARWYYPGEAGRLSLSLHSFSYKRGAPPGLDMMFDCRFLRNPHWVPELRARDGRDAAVAAHVMDDPHHGPFLAQLEALLGLVLPAHLEEGRTHVAIGLGCTGGQHRSVTVVENLAQRLAQAGWQVSIRHRELEHGAPRPPLKGDGERP